MKQLVLAGLMLAAAVSASGQGDYASIRTGASADRLKIATARLADELAHALIRGTSHSRIEIQEGLIAQQIDASVALLIEMIRNRRPVVELREVSSEITALARRAPAGSPQWRQVQTLASDVNRDLTGVSGPSGPSDRPIIGRVSWRGTVDDRVHLAIRGRSIEERTISGAQSPDGTYNFTTALPDRAVDVEVITVSGRGPVRVLQQPSRANDFTAVIEIYDEGSGAKEYRLDIVWR